MPINLYCKLYFLFPKRPKKVDELNYLTCLPMNNHTCTFVVYTNCPLRVVSFNNTAKCALDVNYSKVTSLIAAVFHFVAAGGRTRRQKL